MNELREQMAAADVPVQLALARANYQKTICLLRALKAGAVRIEQVVLDGDNWQVLDPSQVTVPVSEPRTANPDAGGEG